MAGSARAPSYDLIASGGVFKFLKCLMSTKEQSSPSRIEATLLAKVLRYHIYNNGEITTSKIKVFPFRIID